LVELENHFLTGFSDSCFSVIRIGFIGIGFMKRNKDIDGLDTGGETTLTVALIVSK